MNFDSKKWWEVKFFVWNKNIDSLIQASRMNLWCPIIERIEIIMWIHIYPSWKTNINSKIGRKRSFSYETKASIPLSQKGECAYGAQSWNKGDYYVNPCLPHLIDELWFKKWWEVKFFLWNQSINIIYPNKENMFMVPNHEKKRYYYVNPYLSQSTNEL